MAELAALPDGLESRSGGGYPMRKQTGHEGFITIVCLGALSLATCGGAESTVAGNMASSSSPGPLRLTLSPLEGEVQMAYLGTLKAGGGTPPHNWKVAAGVLPAGLRLDPASGLIQGTPVDAGEYGFTIQVQDSSLPSSGTATGDFKLTIAPKLQVATTNLYHSFVSQPYAATLTAWGGIPPYTWSVASGTLPQGMSLDARTGKMSGTPGRGGEFSATIQVTDSLKPSPAVASKTFGLSISDIRLDQYGGLADAPVPGGATGYFHTTKVGNRWVLADPLGNAFWMLSVYVINHIDGGKRYEDAVIAKYGDNKFMFITQALRRLRSWGFNTIGEYSASYAPPIGMYGRREGNREKLPFIVLVNVSYGCAKLGIAKDVYNGVSKTTYKGWFGSLVDAFDPNLPGCAEQGIVESGKRFTGEVEVLAKSPWLLGVTIDDADYTSGFKSGITHVHPGWLTAVTAPSQSENAKLKLSYTDQTVYTKLAFRDFMKARYNGDIRALNAAWGSDYTTFDSAGGWGNGTGLLDEDGRNPWMRITQFEGPLRGPPSNVVADLDAWLLVFARRYFQVMTAASRKVLPHHMVIGPASIDAHNRAQVLQAAGEYLDLLQLQTTSDEVSLLGTAYDSSQKPCIVWTSFGAQNDSPFAGKPSGRRADFDNPTQEARGQKYGDYLKAAFNVQATDGTKPVVGMDWWELVDKVVGGEHANFGLVTPTADNAYDGVEARVTRGVDAWGYTTGGEQNDYGDFISSARRANLGILQSVASEIGGK